MPGAAVDRFAEHAAAGAAEQPPVRGGAVVAEMTAEHADQDGRDGDDAGRPVGAVLEAARLERGAGAGPGGASARAGRGEDDRAATILGEDEVGVGLDGEVGGAQACRCRGAWALASGRARVSLSVDAASALIRAAIAG